jgi:hypothetical protein
VIHDQVVRPAAGVLDWLKQQRAWSEPLAEHREG